MGETIKFTNDQGELMDLDEVDPTDLTLMATHVEIRTPPQLAFAKEITDTIEAPLHTIATQFTDIRKVMQTQNQTVENFCLTIEAIKGDLDNEDKKRISMTEQVHKAIPKPQTQPEEDTMKIDTEFPPTGDKDPNTHQAHTGYIGSTDNK